MLQTSILMQKLPNHNQKHNRANQLQFLNIKVLYFMINPIR